MTEIMSNRRARVLGRKPSFLGRELSASAVTPPRPALAKKIEDLAAATHALGQQPLWEGYGQNNARGPTREANDVRTPALFGAVYADLVSKLKPEIVVEFGTAFGVSGSADSCRALCQGFQPDPDLRCRHKKSSTSSP